MLSDLWTARGGETVAVSISALSDRIAQLLIALVAGVAVVVSISALSDRIAQPSRRAIASSASFSFNIRSFGSNCSAFLLGLAGLPTCQFQYPLFRIELLSVSGDRAQHQALTCFNIRSFGSNCSALKTPPPLSRVVVSISALSDRIAQRLGHLDEQRLFYRFNIRSFGSNCSAIPHRRRHDTF